MGLALTSRGYSETVATLTPAMRDVLRAAAAGRRERDTALDLGVSLSTVKAIRAAAIARLDATTITAAVVVAIRRGEL